MPITRVCLPLHHRMMATGSFLCVAGLVAWSTATAFGQSASAPTPVLVSISTLDMSRLAPAQFGDWEAIPSQSAR